MELLQQYVGEILFGSLGTFLTISIKGYQSLMSRIKKLEHNIVELRGQIDLNTALDNERKKPH